MLGLSKVVFRANVVISGMDVDDITEADPVATVTFDGPAEGRQMARFAGMCVVAMLRATRKTPGMTEPFARQGWIVCDELVQLPPEDDYGLPPLQTTLSDLMFLVVGLSSSFAAYRSSS